VAVGTQHTYPAAPVVDPFASAELIESPAVQSVHVGEPTPLDQAAFLDGIQRYAVEGWIGLVPIVRAYVAAAVLRRESGGLRAAALSEEEFLVAPLSRLGVGQRGSLRDAGLTVHDCDIADERSHPVLDVQRLAALVERRREEAERAVARCFLEGEPVAWLVVDGPITGFGDLFSEAPRLVGLIKSHQTQFLAGRDMRVALTLPAGHRSSVFARGAGKRATVYTWYLRLWPWEERGLLHGLVRVERAPGDEVVAEATRVSRWILAERAPLAAPDARWDRLIYPIQQVEAYLRARAGEW
jgi:hypothetical protein